MKTDVVYILAIPESGSSFRSRFQKTLRVEFLPQIGWKIHKCLCAFNVTGVSQNLDYGFYNVNAELDLIDNVKSLMENIQENLLKDGWEKH